MQKSKLQFKIKNFYLLVVVFSFSFLVFSFCQATTLYLEPSDSKYHQGDTFLVEVRIDIENECINVVDLGLSFSQDILEVIDFSQGDSILTIWPETPIIDQNLGLISFAGGIPGGYCGRLPGDPEKTSLLGKIVFRVVPRGVLRDSAQVVFKDDSQILLNDGLGTLAEFTTKGAVFTILPERLVEPSKDEWQIELRKDNIPPEPFEIKIYQDSAIFDGKYFIVFSTTDKQTGIDYYEVKEGERDWQRVESPYLLEDQSLRSIIKVRAVDKAGNERIAEYLPLPPEKPFPYWLIILILVGIGIIWWIIKHRHRYTQMRIQIHTKKIDIKEKK